jgi:hypothetical protein
MCNPEDADFQVTEAVGAAVVTKNIEVTVDFGALAALTPTMTGNQAKLLVIAALEKIQAYITKGVWPPA